MSLTLSGLLKSLNAYEAALRGQLQLVKPPMPAKLITGHVHCYSLDLPSGHSLQSIDSGREYRVIVAVGINYTQDAQAVASSPFQPWHQSGVMKDSAMRLAARYALDAYVRNSVAWAKLLTSRTGTGSYPNAGCSVPNIGGDDFILVALNLFPFITRKNGPRSQSGMRCR